MRSQSHWHVRRLPFYSNKANIANMRWSAMSRWAGFSLGTALVGALAACGPRVDVGQDLGSSTTDEPPDSTGEAVPGTSGGLPDPDSSSDGGSESGSSTGSGAADSCAAFAQMRWDDSGRIRAQACGDMTLGGLSADLTGYLAISVPPILGSPWDVDWQAHALYTLPDRAVVAQVARYAEPLEYESVMCQEGGGLPDGAVEVYDIEADLDFYLLNRDEVGCIFTCDTVYAEIRNATIDCDGESIPLGASDDAQTGEILIHGYAELP